jgi:hypothetical protein
MNIVEIVTTVARRVGRVLIQPADAHCDSEDGPAVSDGRRALATGNINYALKWVSVDNESEVRDAFDRAAIARTGEPEAVQRAERQFLETLVRIHRADEGAGFDGIKPTGTELSPQVVAADAALELGSTAPLRGLIPAGRWAELEHRFANALAKKGYDVNDLPAARDYVAAYVSFFKYAEGEEHDHAHVGGHHQ